jgi:hypothetical protein
MHHAPVISALGRQENMIQTQPEVHSETLPQKKKIITQISLRSKEIDQVVIQINIKL